MPMPEKPRSVSRKPRSTPRLAGADRRAQIIAVATELFAAQGFRGTTTREIARRAGVNEAILFRHFAKKEDLYWAVLEAKCEATGARRRLHAVISAGGDERSVLTAIAADILERNIRDSSLTRLLFFSALENHDLTERYFRGYGDRYVEDLAGYVRERIRSGRFRKVDPLIAARGFLGMVVYHFLVHELFLGRRRAPLHIPEASKTLASIWIEGMRK